MESFARALLLFVAVVLLGTYVNHGGAGVHLRLRTLFLGSSSERGPFTTRP